MIMVALIIMQHYSLVLLALLKICFSFNLMVLLSMDPVTSLYLLKKINKKPIKG